MRAPTTIRNQMDLAEYKRFIRNHIIQMQEKAIMDTKEKIVGIFSIMIQVFRLSHASAGDIKTDIAADGSAIAAKRYKEHSQADYFVQNENLNVSVFAYEETTATASATSMATNQGSYYLWKQYS
ncbi:MAG: hypothetical protein EZS28_000555 [Streblomastix strix]|uniref:Uncharacterized protein n=1 Tax=Streblomastix strix TaxID=222440 RepID=A0A5J4X9P1_9EUKA|nr:MAG: hypothetical protein EZS28_000555 [Streblomastix strix]